jgi:hypothetical protein
MVEVVVIGRMSDITYAEVEIVLFMKPKIRTRHERPKNRLTRTPFDRCHIWYAEVEMLYKAMNAKGVDTLDLLISTWRGLGLDGRGGAEGAEVDSNSGQA